jgi:hypothetical protein
LENKVCTLQVENERLDKNNKDLSDILKESEKLINAEAQERIHQLEADLQAANFEKNRLKDTI